MSLANPAISVQVIDGQCCIYVDKILIGSYGAEEFVQNTDQIIPVLGEFGIEKIDIPCGLYLLDGRCIYIYDKSPTRKMEDRQIKATYCYRYFDFGASAISGDSIRTGTLIDTDFALKRLIKIEDDQQLQSLLMIPKAILSHLKRQQEAIQRVIDTVNAIEKPEEPEEAEESDS